jgi:hypothetical protein
MKKILSALVAVAWLAPVAPAFAEDPAAAGAKKAGEEAIQAGEKAEVAGEKAVKAGHEAQRATDAKHSRYADYYGKGVKEARRAKGKLELADPGLTRLFDTAPGYAVFATVGKGAVGIGGAHGNGVLFEKGSAMGKTTLTQVTVGLQLGGQAYSEVIFFETDKALADFKKGEFTMAAQVSAVAATAGASANAKYVDGVSVFTLAKGGVMAEASVGGQKFSYLPFHKPITTSSL